MCFYAQKRWNCGYWKWSGFKQQCKDETRIGETCGLKLVHEVLDQGEKCSICCDIEKKKRKIEKMDADLKRWKKEGNKPATIDLTMGERTDAEVKIAQLREKHARDINTLSNRKPDSREWPMSASFKSKKAKNSANTYYTKTPSKRVPKPGQERLPPISGGHHDAWGAQTPPQHSETWGNRSQAQTPPYQGEYRQGHSDDQAQNQPLQRDPYDDSWRDRPQVQHPYLPGERQSPHEGYDEAHYQYSTQYQQSTQNTQYPGAYKGYQEVQPLHTAPDYGDHPQAQYPGGHRQSGYDCSQPPVQYAAGYRQDEYGDYPQTQSQQFSGTYRRYS